MLLQRGLAQRKTYNIALLMPKDYVATEFLFFKDCMNGICEVASAHDYDIIISMIDGADVSQIERLEANQKGRRNYSKQSSGKFQGTEISEEL